VKRIPWARLGPAGRVDLRIEAFNVLNHPNLGDPNADNGGVENNPALASFGRVTSKTGNRTIQLGLKLSF